MNYKQSIALELYRERRAQDIARTLPIIQKNIFCPPFIMDF